MPWRPPTHKPVPWHPPSFNRSNSERSYYRSKEWKEKRAAVLSRDRHTCQLRLSGCWGYATLVDHKEARNEGGSDDWDNLRASCPACHNRRHPEKGHASRD